MKDGLRLCKRGHDLDRVGQTSRRQCMACRRDMDRARDPARRARRKLDHNPEPFDSGQGYLFDRRGFGWREDVFLIKDRLLTLAKRMTDQRRDPHPWAVMAQHAVSCLEDEHMSPWDYQREFFPDKHGAFYFASESMMGSYWNFLEQPVEDQYEEWERAST